MGCRIIQITNERVNTYLHSLVLKLFHGYCDEKAGGADAVSAEVNCNFRVPPEWRKVTSNVYTLKNFTKTFKEWHRFLSAGYQPWRYESINAAAACLWGFGIRDNGFVFDFANRLAEIKENNVVCAWNAEKELLCLRAGTYISSHSLQTGDNRKITFQRKQRTTNSSTGCGRKVG